MHISLYCYVASDTVLIVGGVGCNGMVRERNGSVCAMDNRYCVDNGAMIAQAGIFAYQMNSTTPLSETTCTQRFRTDAVDVIWRK